MQIFFWIMAISADRGVTRSETRRLRCLSVSVGARLCSGWRLPTPLSTQVASMRTRAASTAAHTASARLG